MTKAEAIAARDALVADLAQAQVDFQAAKATYKTLGTKFQNLENLIEQYNKSESLIDEIIDLLDTPS